MSHRYAVLIGISTFTDENKLTDLVCPTRDVDGLTKILVSQARGNFTDINLLKNEPSHKVIREVQRTFNKAGKDDLVLLYYSGHGKLNRAGKLYLATSDTVLDELESSAVSVSRISEFVDVSSCRKVVIILDCCFSGAAGKIFTKGSVEDQLQLSGGQGTYIMTASTEIQVAEEKKGDEYSVFTKHLINGIESGEADLNGDGVITIDEIYEHINRNVSAESPQKPTKWGMDLRGDIIIAKSGKTPRGDRRIKIRKILMEWANDERIPDSILTEALSVIKLPTDQLSELQKAYDELMDKLLQGKLRPGEFVEEWTMIGGVLRSMRNAEEEQRLIVEAETIRKAEIEHQSRKEAEAKKKAEDERRSKEEAETKRIVEEEHRFKEETEAKRKAEEEIRLKKRAEDGTKTFLQDKIENKREPEVDSSASIRKVATLIGFLIGTVVGMFAMSTLGESVDYQGYLWGLLTGLGGAIAGAVCRKEKRRIRAAIIGGVLGWIIGAIIWIFINPGEEGDAFAAGGVFGAPVGLIIGSIIGNKIYRNRYK